MSTFGNKALVWWDYHNMTSDNAKRYNKTPEDIQLKILQKWYPIGMKCKFLSRKFSEYTEYKIVSYTHRKFLTNVIYFVELIPDIPFKDGLKFQAEAAHPLSIKPVESEEKSLKRSYKIDRLL